MSRPVVIHQPDFLPYLGFFHRFLEAELYVALDHVQFVHSNRGWTHRDRIKTAGGAQWLTVGVQKAPRDTPINAIELARDNWRARHLNLLRHNYRNALHFAEVFAELESLYALRCTMLVDFTVASIEMLLRMFDISIPRVMSSSLHPAGRKNELLVDILRRVGSTHYLSGAGARDYFDPAPFSAAGIQVTWQTFEHPEYPQLHGEFLPYMSSIDMLFNCGIRRSREILRSC